MNLQCVCVGNYSTASEMTSFDTVGLFVYSDCVFCTAGKLVKNHFSPHGHKFVTTTVTISSTKPNISPISGDHFPVKPVSAPERFKPSDVDLGRVMACGERKCGRWRCAPNRPWCSGQNSKCCEPVCDSSSLQVHSHSDSDSFRILSCLSFTMDCHCGHLSLHLLNALVQTRMSSLLPR